MPTPTPTATLSLPPSLLPVSAAEVVAAPSKADVVVAAGVVDGDDMAKEGVVVDKVRYVGDVVDEGDVEIEVDRSLILKWWDWMIVPLANEALLPASVSYNSR